MAEDAAPRGDRNAARWLSQAEHDLADAELVAGAGRHALACFLCHQAAEKAVTAYLLARGAEQVWGHALADLCEDAMALDPSFDFIKSVAGLLDKHHLGARYPSALPGGVPAEAFDRHDSDRALEIARQVHQFVRARLAELAPVDNRRGEGDSSGGAPGGGAPAAAPRRPSKGEATMAAPRTVGVHHLRLTVSDLERSLAFYTEVLGFELRMRFGPDSVLLHDGTVGLGLNTPWHDISPAEKRFDEARVGLDHVGFRVASPDDVRAAADHLDAHGVARSEVKPGRLPDSLLVVFRDPDNIQLEYYYTP